MKDQTLVPIQKLSDDILAALVARDKVRKLGGSLMTRPHDFITFFNELTKSRGGKNEKDAAKFERQRKEEIHNYIQASNWGWVNDEKVLVAVTVD